MDITVNLISNAHHCSQILTGLILLSKQNGFRLNINNCFNNPMYKHIAVVEVLAGEKRIIYDMMDGYLAIDSMRNYIENSDFYFKRSFSEDKNTELFPDLKDKIYPLGMNYDVSCIGNPYSNLSLKEIVKYIMGIKPFAWFTPERFETKIKNPAENF
jgi:hypothetical protein